MENDGIRTSHDLADLLEDAARVLRMLPVMVLDTEQQPKKGLRTGKSGMSSTDKKDAKESLLLLANRLPALDRTEAQHQLASLTVALIRQLGHLLNVRIPSKGTKDESINLLLTHLFDAPAGQELIRTFHKRNTAASKLTLLGSSTKMGNAVAGKRRTNIEPSR